MEDWIGPVYHWFDRLPAMLDVLDRCVPGAGEKYTSSAEKAKQYEGGEISKDEYDFADSMKRNELQNVAFYTQSMGEIVILAVIVGIMSVKTSCTAP